MLASIKSNGWDLVVVILRVDLIISVGLQCEMTDLSLVDTSGSVSWFRTEVSFIHMDLLQRYLDLQT